MPPAAITRSTTRRLAAVGLAAGLLSGLLGIGGGIVIVPGLVWAAGLDRRAAAGTSLLAITPIAFVGAVTYALAPSGAFDPPASALLLVGSLAGAFVGARANARASERGLRLALAVISLVFGVRLVAPFGLAHGTDALAPTAVAVLVLIGVGGLGGMLAGLLGVGGSVIMVALLVVALHAGQVLAQGIALTATIPTVLVGAAQHRRQGSLAPRVGLTVGLVGTLGAVPGAFAAFALPADALRTAFGVFLLFSGARTLLAVRRSTRA